MVSLLESTRDGAKWGGITGAVLGTAATLTLVLAQEMYKTHPVGPDTLNGIPLKELFLFGNFLTDAVALAIAGGVIGFIAGLAGKAIHRRKM